MADGGDDALPDIAVPSVVPGAWPADHALAAMNAREVLGRIDFSKRDIVLWVPGTDGGSLKPAMGDALRANFGAATSTMTYLTYPASWDMRTSVGTGLRTLRLVLQGIAAAGGNHRVLLVGESQGAWLISEAAADPRVGKVITKAVLMGHPSSALHHYPSAHEAPASERIVEIANPLDKVTMQTWGSEQTAMDAVIMLQHPKAENLPTIIAAAIQNPIHGLLAGADFLRDRLPRNARWLLPDPHDYSGSFAAAAQMLAAAQW